MGGICRRRTYDKQFKLEAVHLVLEEGHSARSVEQKSGTGQRVVSIWVNQFKCGLNVPD
jgi:transposase-like protein